MQPANWFQIEDVLNNVQHTALNTQYPAYFNTSDYTWCTFLSENYKLLLEEFETFTSNHTIQAYFNDTQALNGKWKTLPLITWNIRRKYLKSFPETKKVLDKIPGLVSASYSILEAGGEILEHKGDSDVHIRAHICLYTASDYKLAAFTVNNEVTHWQEGKCMLFCDAHLHGGYNHSKQNRLVMIIDILHTKNIAHKNTVCAKVLSGLAINYLIIFMRLTKLNVFTRFLLKIVYQLFQWIFRCIFFMDIVL